MPKRVNAIVVQLLSCVQLSATPQTAAHQASLSFTTSRSLLKLMSIESMMPSNYRILCCHLLLLALIFPSIRVFSSGSALHIRWPEYWKLMDKAFSNGTIIVTLLIYLYFSTFRILIT